MSSLDIRTVSYLHPDAQSLIAEVQLEYVRRYGGPDESPVQPEGFSKPNGLFGVGYDNDAPVVMGGWRRRLMDAGPLAGHTAAELKRMYVSTPARGHGHARAMLAWLEDSVAAAGIDWVVLETGTKQPEAMQLYRSAGYREVTPFGFYADAPLAVHLGKHLRPA